MAGKVGGAENWIGRMGGLVAMLAVLLPAGLALAIFWRRGWSAPLELGLALAALAVSLAFAVYVHWFWVRPARVLMGFFAQRAAETEPDLTREIPLEQQTPLRPIAENYQAFLANLRRAVAESRKMSINIAAEAAKMNKRVGGSHDKAQNQERQAGDLTEVTSQSAAESVASVEAIGQRMAGLGKTIEDLAGSADHIQKVVNLVRGVAMQTNLLALNAAVEAARAGESGAGFAVVSEEVKNLAQKVDEAVDEIATTAETLAQAMGRARQDAVETIAYVERINLRTKDDARASGEKIGQIMRLSQEVAGDMQESLGYCRSLREATERLQGLITRFSVGQGALEKALGYARGYRDLVQRRMDELAQGGLNLLDRSYREIPDSNPKKYRTAYDEVFAREFQGLFDQALKGLAGGAYFIAVDANGYAPTHHSHVSRPLTGDYERDLLHSRDKRIFASNETEVRRARHTQPFLLQTYLRDTGEILNDISLPLFVNGRHWGALIVGMDYQVLLQD
ncbi:MAG: methyl-accepting chemotaxis protein [Thermodesulfobacteriota bacterium]